MSDFSTVADEEDIEGITDCFIDAKYVMSSVEVLNNVQKTNVWKRTKDLEDLGCCSIDPFKV